MAGKLKHKPYAHGEAPTTPHVFLTDDPEHFDKEKATNWGWLMQRLAYYAGLKRTVYVTHAWGTLIPFEPHELNKGQAGNKARGIWAHAYDPRREVNASWWK